VNLPFIAAKPGDLLAAQIPRLVVEQKGMLPHIQHERRIEPGDIAVILAPAKTFLSPASAGDLYVIYLRADSIKDEVRKS
jgi:hypothetical protein